MKFLTVGLGGTTVTFNGEPTDAPWLCPIVASRHVTNARKRRITGAPAATYTTSVGMRCSRLDVPGGKPEPGIR